MPTYIWIYIYNIHIYFKKYFYFSRISSPGPYGQCQKPNKSNYRLSYIANEEIKKDKWKRIIHFNIHLLSTVFSLIFIVVF